ncbi:MAG: pantoate--beta-alanine ligase [Chloroflexota bacterium]|nr:pantoate--beta-alanine ligase [Chloroflexota bacterium]
MNAVTLPAELRQRIGETRRQNCSVGFVPTMGCLHSGHLRLVRQAREENDLVVVSIYVNPTQFGPQEDFARYPRDLDTDRRLADEAGVDLLFLPDTATIYPAGPDGQQVWIDPGAMAQCLCGASRPGHFRGVATMVAKLFHLVQPDRAYFGAKDGQQAAIITRMVTDLAFPIEIRVASTVREKDGLALSSRNVYLTPDQRHEAVALSQVLNLAKAYLTAGGRNARELEKVARDHLTRAAPLGRIDYVTAVDLVTLQPAPDEIDRDIMLALAVYFGRTRLIDNRVVRFTPSGLEFQ